jgi:hypothetical protein
MKKLITILALAVVVACPLASFAQDGIEADPAYVPIDKFLDLKATPPTVNVNIPRFLLKDAIAGLTNAPNNGLTTSGIDLADLVKDVKLIRVVVIEAKTNHGVLEKSIKSLRSELDSKWTSIVSVPEGNVGVYAKGDPSGESVAGLAVVVFDHGSAVVVNVVGHVSVGKVIRAAAQMHKLPEDLVKQLGLSTGQTVSTTGGKSSGNVNTNKSAETVEPAPKDSSDK